MIRAQQKILDMEEQEKQRTKELEIAIKATEDAHKYNKKAQTKQQLWLKAKIDSIRINACFSKSTGYFVTDFSMFREKDRNGSG